MNPIVVVYFAISGEMVAATKTLVPGNRVDPRASDRADTSAPAADALSDPLTDPLSDSLADSLITHTSSAGTPIQGSGGTLGGFVQRSADRGLSGPSGLLPHLGRVQASFGDIDVRGVRAHTDGAAQRAAGQMGAAGFTRGEHVALGASPSLRTVAHEAAHVVQQRSGVSVPGGVGQAGDSYEQQADEVADRVVRGDSAEPLLAGAGAASPSAADPPDSPLQRKTLQALFESEELATKIDEQMALEAIKEEVQVKIRQRYPSLASEWIEAERGGESFFAFYHELVEEVRPRPAAQDITVAAFAGSPDELAALLHDQMDYEGVKPEIQAKMFRVGPSVAAKWQQGGRGGATFNEFYSVLLDSFASGDDLEEHDEEEAGGDVLASGGTIEDTSADDFVAPFAAQVGDVGTPDGWIKQAEHFLNNYQRVPKKELGEEDLDDLRARVAAKSSGMDEEFEEEDEELGDEQSLLGGSGGDETKSLAKAMVPMGKARKIRLKTMAISEGLTDILFNSFSFVAENLTVELSTPVAAGIGGAYKGGFAAEAEHIKGGSKKKMGAAAAGTGAAEFAQALIPELGSIWGVTGGAMQIGDTLRLGKRAKGMKKGMGGGSSQMAQQSETVGDRRVFQVLEPRLAR